MDISGSYTFDAPPDRVWALLMDPAVISSCIPGCDRFEPSGENSYRVTLTVALAAITGTYEGAVTLTDLVAPSSYRLIAEGQGRPGFVKGKLRHHAACGRRDHDRGRRGHRSDGRPDRSPRPAPDWRRVEDDARSLLRVLAGEADHERGLTTLAPAPPATRAA